MQEMESNTRKLQQSLVPLGEKLAEIANTILPPLVSVIQTVSSWFAQLPGPVQNFIVILGALLAAFTALTPVIAALAVSVGALNISLLPIIAVIAAVAAAIAGIIAIIQNWGAITEWFGNLWNTICTGIGTMIESVKTWFSNLWTHLQNVWNGICNVVQTAVMLLGSIIQGAVDIITAAVPVYLGELQRYRHFRLEWDQGYRQFRAVSHFRCDLQHHGGDPERDQFHLERHQQ